MFWTIIGVIAASLTSFGFIPQLIKGVQTKHLNDVSALSLVVMILGTTLWGFYGYHIGDRILVGANIFTSSSVTIVLFLKIRYEKEHVVKEKTENSN
jgi:MtN3 and saliva related transmembrane protein